MQLCVLMVVVMALVSAQSLYAADASQAVQFDWQALPALPGEVGYAGMYAGVSHGTLIVAGGANFPDKPHAQGGQKKWHDTIYVLPEGEAKWRLAKTRLPRALGYGVSVTYGDEVICVGGNSGPTNHREVFALQWDGQDVAIKQLPVLPHACAMMSGAMVGSTLYIAGGASSPAETKALRTFWAMDLAAADDELAWRELEPWPGPERQLAVAAAYGGRFYLVSGMQLKARDTGKPFPVAPYLADAYCYTPGGGNGAAQGSWRKIASPPVPVAAAPSPAASIAGHGFAILGGLDGSRLGADLANYPPFSRDVYMYEPAGNTWTLAGRMPAWAVRITSPALHWAGGYIAVNGEIFPGIRTPSVLKLTISE